MKSLLAALVLLTSSPSLAQEGDDGDGVVVEQLDQARSQVTCRRLVGVAAGVFQPGRSWEFSVSNVAVAGSPVLSMTCDFDLAVPIMVGADFMPWYETRRWGSSTGHRVWMALVLGSLPVEWQSMRAGPVATVSLLRVGGGVRLQHLSFGEPGKRHGFEYRLQAFYNGGLEVQLMATYMLHSKRSAR